LSGDHRVVIDRLEDARSRALRHALRGAPLYLDRATCVDPNAVVEEER
jgi:hypothetical protein